MKQRLVAFAAAALVIAVFPAFAAAHPDEAGELYIPWSDDVGQERAQELTRGAPQAEAPTPGAQNLRLVGNSDKDGTTNSDLAFNDNLVYSGNYDGFRILDVRGQQPRVVVDHACRGPQNDVSFTKLGGKTFLFQSIDSGQTAEDCTSVDAHVVGGMRVGYEGVRVFDVTNPASPKFIDMIQTACGSHTHTLIPDNSRPPRRRQRQGVHLRLLVSAGQWHHPGRPAESSGRRRLQGVHRSAQEDLDHRGLRARRRVQLPPARAGAGRGHDADRAEPGHAVVRRVP